MHVLPVERALKQPDDIVPNGVFRREALGPGQEHALVKCGLLDREGEGKAEGDRRGLGIVGVRELVTRVS